MNWLLILFKVQSLFFILLKVSLLLKYFLFIKYRSGDWKASHLLYYPENDIVLSKNFTVVKAKKFQNYLSTAFVHLIVLVILIRLMMKAFVG